MVDWDKIAQGRDMIEAAGGFAVVIWTEGDITSDERFVGTDEDARIWFIENNRSMGDYLAEKGNQYLSNECGLLNGEGNEGDDHD